MELLQVELAEVKEQLRTADSILAVVRSQRDEVTRRYNEQAGQLRQLERSGVRIPLRWIAVSTAELRWDCQKHEMEELKAKSVPKKTESNSNISLTVFCSDGTFKSHAEMISIAKLIDIQWTAVQQWLDEHFSSWPFFWEGVELYKQVIRRLADAHIVLQSHELRDSKHYYKFAFVSEAK